MDKKDYLILICILCIAFALRLYKIDTPLADLHSWRQADTAAVSRNFTRNGIDLLKPRYDDLSSLQTGQENPEGLRYVEFPLYNAINAISYLAFPSLPVEVHGRMISILFSLILIAILYYFGKMEHSRIAGFSAATIYAIMPSFVFFSRVVLPETPAVASSWIGLFFIYLSLFRAKSKQNQMIYLLSGALFFAFGLLIKPTTIFYYIAAAYLFLHRFHIRVFTNWRPYIFLFLSAIPLVWWRYYISYFPQGIPASDWLIGYVNTAQGLQYIFFRPAFFRWMFLDRIGTAIMGIYLTGYIFTGVAGSNKRYFILSCFVSAMTYLFVFQGGNIQHEYYQTIAFPGIALVAGLGIATLTALSPQILNPFLLYPAIVTTILLSFFISYYKTKDYYHIPQDLPPIATLIKEQTKSTDKIVTDRLGDTTLLYLADRKGAPAIYKELPQLKELGYSYLVTANKDLIESLRLQKKDILIESNQFAIIRL